MFNVNGLSSNTKTYSCLDFFVVHVDQKGQIFAGLIAVSFFLQWKDASSNG